MEDSLAGMDGAGKGVRCVTAANGGVLTGAGTNSWLLGQGQVAMVDPGPDLPAHQAALLAALAPGEAISLILITHAHADHAALAPAMAAVTGAPVAVLHDGARFTGSWGVMQALHTPGHHPDHFCLIGPGWAITGDHVMGWSSSLIAPPEGRMADYMHSLTRLEAAGAPLGLPGHGPPIPDLPQRIRALRRHRQMRSAAIQAAVQEGLQGLTAITLRAYGAMDPALTRAATANCLAHLIDLTERKLISASSLPSADAIFAPM